MAVDHGRGATNLDDALLEVLPDGCEVTALVKLPGLSDWCQTTRLDIRMPNGSTQQFFEKAAVGPDGLELMSSHWRCETSVHSFVPELTPEPVAMGTYKSRPDKHFYLMRFLDMIPDVIPGPDLYMGAVASLHIRSMGHAPGGRFGFSGKGWFGDLPHANGWADSWELWWTRHMQMVLDRDETIRGPLDAEAAQVRSDFMSRVLPRYLRPLEIGHRKIKPCLIHWDLWPGNVKYRADQSSVVVFDATCIWGHNEADLGPIMNPRYPLGQPYLEAYRKHVPVSDPKEDADSRLIMYMIRNEVCISTLYPDNTELRDIYLNSMRLLVHRVAQEGRGGHNAMEETIALSTSSSDILPRSQFQPDPVATSA